MAAAPSSLGDQIRGELSCGICLELFTRPKMLPCQHTFCQDCLQDHAGRGGAFKCPNCRLQVFVPSQGVTGLPDNHIVANLCERLQQQATLSEETREQNQYGNKCSFHPSEEVKLYCKQCQMTLCLDCVEESHDGHPTTSLRRASEERRSTVQAMMPEGRDILEPAVLEPTENFTSTTALGTVTVPGATASSGAATAVMGRHHAESRCHTVAPIDRLTFGEPGRFNWPSGVTVSEEGEIFVADCENERIQVFTLQGTFVRQFPTVVPGGQEMEPLDVALDGEGNLWVVGDTDSAVQYDKQGRVLKKFDIQETVWERGVAVDTRRNHILVTQTTGDWNFKHGEVLVFRPDGTLVRTVGQQKGMKHPVYINVDGEGNILVTDSKNHCVYAFNEDGQFLFKFGGEGSGEGQLKDPCGICTDRAGNIIVANLGNSRVEMFDKKGRFLKHVTTDMKSPCAVAMAPKGQLVVTDTVDITVTIFKHGDCG